MLGQIEAFHTESEGKAEEEVKEEAEGEAEKGGEWVLLAEDLVARAANEIVPLVVSCDSDEAVEVLAEVGQNLFVLVHGVRHREEVDLCDAPRGSVSTASLARGSEDSISMAGGVEFVRRKKEGEKVARPLAPCAAASPVAARAAGKRPVEAEQCLWAEKRARPSGSARRLAGPTPSAVEYWAPSMEIIPGGKHVTAVDSITDCCCVQNGSQGILVPV